LTTIAGAREWKRVEYGVTPGGFFDALAAALANRAAGNDDDAPLLECVMVGPRLRFREPRRAAFCDGSGNVRTFALNAGEELDVGRFHGGLRGYLAIEGGIDEMRATFAEGPHVMRKNDELRAAESGVANRESGVGEPNQFQNGVRERNRSDPRQPTTDNRRKDTRNIIQIIRGPHDAPPLPEEWEVTPELNRIGIRLRRVGEIAASDETLPRLLPSCGMQFGTLQWHPDGSLVAMGPDHPVTGGYLQPATVITDDLWKLAQLAPGERVRLIAV
jgi:urea carboxylase